MRTVYRYIQYIRTVYRYIQPLCVRYMRTVYRYVQYIRTVYRYIQPLCVSYIQAYIFMIELRPCYFIYRDAEEISFASYNVHLNGTIHMKQFSAGATHNTT